ncbi:MAG: 2-hydroxychromene-2-carboxylate isomerase [Proteobacteria bacterium]|nr:2-hydroxychromene-2-carboxylate isomerase [Pseudomonadota bacterium]
MALAVDFYYGLGSRYSYLASTQLDRIAAATGCRFDWHPLKSGALMELRGGHPFRGEPASGQYEWPYRRLDAEAWAEFYGVPYREPVDFRVDPAYLAVAASAAKRLGAVEAYSRRLFQAIFVEGGAIAEADLIGFAADVGLDAQAFRTHLEDPATAELHEAALQEAHRRGAFGVPTFFVGKRLFWGNDRLPLVAHFIEKARAAGPA